jgi:hypothetical protein
MKRATVALALLCTVAILGLHTKCVAGITHEEGAGSNNPKSKVENNQHPPTNSPSVVLLGASQPDPAVHDSDVDEKKERIEVDRQLVNFTAQLAKYTALLAYYTGALILVGGVQAWFLFTQAKRLGHHSEHLGKLAEATRDSIILTHRPRLVVREIYMFPYTTHADVTINFTMANSGEAPATITESIIEVQPITDGIIKPLREDDSPYTIKRGIINVVAYPEKTITIEPGSFMRHRYSSDVPQQKFINAYSGSGEFPLLYFRGHIAYVDALGTRRHMAFCRRYDFEAHRFCRLDDPDYDYAD